MYGMANFPASSPTLGLDFADLYYKMKEVGGGIDFPSQCSNTFSR